MSDDAVLIVGLGNPGSEYVSTRHNAGFMLLDRFCEALGASMTQAKFKGIFGTARYGGRSLYLLKPQTYMNLSGESVVACMSFYHLDISRVIVLHDELDLALGDVRFKVGGGTGGHNGLKSIVSLTGKDGFSRVRIGIGRPAHNDVVNYVLGRIPAEDEDSFNNSLNIGTEALKRCISDSAEASMRYCNGLFKAKKKEEASHGES
ncbi:MAG: aminoacyl-tRNA hydrolase [Proteobacteria bacterium]|nr:aminoacyl-tRNA hydrolase [Pseudomonadota bacterium]MBQ4359261.1 aminoacyl-tRNA hydrolase [Pseudomonadota bacterium]